MWACVVIGIETFFCFQRRVDYHSGGLRGQLSRGGGHLLCYRIHGSLLPPARQCGPHLQWWAQRNSGKTFSEKTPTRNSLCVMSQEFLSDSWNCSLQTPLPVASKNINSKSPLHGVSRMPIVVPPLNYCHCSPCHQNPIRFCFFQRRLLQLFCTVRSIFCSLIAKPSKIWSCQKEVRFDGYLWLISMREWYQKDKRLNARS